MEIFIMWISGAVAGYVAGFFVARDIYKRDDAAPSPSPKEK